MGNRSPLACALHPAALEVAMTAPIVEGLNVISSDGYRVGIVQEFRDGVLVVRTNRLFKEFMYLDETLIADVQNGEVILRPTYESVSSLANEYPPGSPPRDPSADWAIRNDES